MPQGAARQAGPFRLPALDAGRGLAVMGILAMNIVDFGLPGGAYTDPHVAGGADDANWWAWAVCFVLADGKMRGLFSILFGAGIILLAQAAEASGPDPARRHYARMAALAAIGMAHAWLIWSGDILVPYALCGALVYPMWRLAPRALFAAAGVLLALQLALGVVTYTDARRFERLATAPDASAAERARYAAWKVDETETAQSARDDLRAYRGDWPTVQRARAQMTGWMQTEGLMLLFPDTPALMLIGMALCRLGFFAGAWPRRRYAVLVVIGYGICAPLHIPLILMLERSGFAAAPQMLSEAINLTLLRPMLSLAHASAIILLVLSGRAPALVARLAAVGRAALSNYLGTSIAATWLFYGYGLGWYGHLSRWQLYAVALPIWIIMLLWSRPWLERFTYGPFEWLWRSLTDLRLVPIRRERLANGLAS